MTHQTVSLEKYRKLFPDTLTALRNNGSSVSVRSVDIILKITKLELVYEILTMKR